MTYSAEKWLQVMQDTGKKIRRLRLPHQLCVSEEMAREIHRRAERSFRSKEDEIRWLISLGMMREDEISGNEQERNSPHRESPTSTEGA